MAQFTEVNGRDVGDVRVYALSTCGWCKKAKTFLRDNNIKYAFIDVDRLEPKEAEDVRRQQLKHNPAGSFPTIVVNGQCIVGYDEARLNELARR
jgi:glutaredoxin